MANALLTHTLRVQASRQAVNTQQTIQPRHSVVNVNQRRTAQSIKDKDKRK